MHKIDKFDKRNHFEIVENQLRGHCFKNYKEITANVWNSLPSGIEQF